MGLNMNKSIYVEPTNHEVVEYEMSLSISPLH